VITIEQLKTKVAEFKAFEEVKDVPVVKR